jgi:hypothetical protein
MNASPVTNTDVEGAYGITRWQGVTQDPPAAVYGAVERVKSQRLPLTLLAIFLVINIGMQLVNSQILRGFIDAATSGRSTQQLAEWIHDSERLLAGAGD